MVSGAAPKVVAIIAVAAFFALVPAQSSPGGGIPLGPDCHPEGGHGCGPSGPGFLTYDEALSAGLPVPEIDPSLAMCGASTSDGFETLAEEEAVVDWNAEPTCQVDPREADYPKGASRRGMSAMTRARELAREAHREIRALAPMQSGGPFQNMELEYGRLDADRVLTNHLH